MKLARFCLVHEFGKDGRGKGSEAGLTWAKAGFFSSWLHINKIVNLDKIPGKTKEKWERLNETAFSDWTARMLCHRAFAEEEKIPTIAWQFFPDTGEKHPVFHCKFFFCVFFSNFTSAFVTDAKPNAFLQTKRKRLLKWWN
jgi:hypothetical protein